MRLRITQTTEGPTTVITIDGQLVGDGVAELARVYQAAVPPMALDLTHLQQADADGIALLKALADAGAQLRGVSPYIALLLDRPQT
jgi:ABC-type transporter Mla MlaB component